MVFLFRVQTFDWWLVGERESDESSAAVECSVSASGVETFRTSAGPTLHYTVNCHPFVCTAVMHCTGPAR